MKQIIGKRRKIYKLKKKKFNTINKTIKYFKLNTKKYTVS